MDALIADAHRFFDQRGFRAGTLELLRSGVSSTNLLANYHAGVYLVRAELFRSLRDVVADVQVAEACRGAGVTTYEPPLFVGLWGEVPVVVRPFMPGAILDEHPELLASRASDAGRQLGLIHRVAPPVARPWFYASAVATPEAITAPDTPLTIEARHRIDHLGRDLRQALLARQSLVHTDFKANNLVAVDDGIAVLDWEKATAGSQLFDLGLAVFHLCASNPRELDAEMLLGFLRAYAGAAMLPFQDPAWRYLITASVFAASVFFLVDSEIAMKVDAVGASQHESYYREYCLPAYSRMLSRLEVLTGIVRQLPVPDMVRGA